MRRIAATVFACLLLGGCGRHGTMADLLAAGSPAVCSAPDVETRVQALLRPDTRQVKAVIRANDYPMKPNDVDALAAGIGFDLSEANATAAKPDAVSCSAQLTMLSDQHGIASAPLTIGYRVTRIAALPGYAVDLTDRVGTAAARALFRQIAAKVSGIAELADAGDPQAALGAVQGNAVDDDGADGDDNNVQPAAFSAITLDSLGSTNTH